MAFPVAFVGAGTAAVCAMLPHPAANIEATTSFPMEWCIPTPSSYVLFLYYRKIKAK
jgi:hypothetical protein